MPRSRRPFHRLRSTLMVLLIGTLLGLAGCRSSSRAPPPCCAVQERDAFVISYALYDAVPVRDKGFAHDRADQRRADVHIRSPVRVNDAKELADFLARSRQLSSLEVRGSEVWAGGWTVPPGTTGAELLATARESLRLKESVSLFDGQVGARLSYRLEHDGRQIPANISLAEHATINLRVTVQWFWPKRPGANLSFRTTKSGDLSQAMRNRLLTMAFSHLAPGRSRCLR